MVSKCDHKSPPVKKAEGDFSTEEEGKWALRQDAKMLALKMEGGTLDKEYKE